MSGAVEHPAVASMVAGTVRYILSCTALEVGDGERVILADHRILPLSWTRDAYYQAQLLLATAPANDRAITTVAEHLRWLWGRARQPDGWMRSHLPDGRPKDHAITADQQLYPILELADYRRIVGGWPAPPRSAASAGADAVSDPAAAWGRMVADAWRSLPRRGSDGFLATQENPADDPTDYPYTVSTQILYWFTALNLLPWSEELGIEDLRLGEAADGIRAAVGRRFVRSGPLGPQWAYEIDDANAHRLFQDANDLPTAFAPLLGFCSADDEVWQTTMRFAFSRHNPMFVAGRFGGLGSAHTPGTWSLGDAQELAVAMATGDRERLDTVLARVSRVVGPDGLLPETYHPETGAWLARLWFAWPSAALGSLGLGAVAAVAQPRSRPAG